MVLRRFGLRLTAALLITIITAALPGTLALPAVGALPAGVALADGSLRRGDKGQAVKKLQERLKDYDCYDYDEITGYFGAVTEDGVRKFQSTHGLVVDGVAGKETLRLLDLDVSANQTLKPDSYCKGMSGSAIKEIQTKLKEMGLFTEPQVTNYFGPKTEAAVKAFQEAAGLKADGIVGKQTYNKLMSNYRPDSLIPGMMNENVKKLQKRLNSLGYYSGKQTGVYDQVTVKAVTDFQKLNGLSADGIAGLQTRVDLFSDNARTEKVARRNPLPPKTKSKVSTDQSAAGKTKAAKVIDVAMTKLGCPYVRGAAGPNSFECSGLTYWTFQQIGVTLPRKAYGQGYTNYGIKITDKSKLMPGDLVFFNTNKSDSDLCDHVGIYVGDGKFINAPAPGYKVKISDLSGWNGFSWGRRVFS
jgi:peptidoglycan endopeptidase LytE